VLHHRVRYIYLCCMCLIAKLWVRIQFTARCTGYNIIWSSLSVTCGRSLIFSGYSCFLHQENGLPRYCWNIVESGVKDHNTQTHLIVQTLVKSIRKPLIFLYIFHMKFQFKFFLFWSQFMADFEFFFINSSRKCVYSLL
jgi:hypothetical protein